MFYRLSTDGIRQDVALEGTYGGPVPSACWLIGGGSTLTQMPLEKITGSPAPRMCLNLAGSGLFRPNLWTSYDPSARFHRSVYLDPGITKFVHRRRAMDLVPETTFKVCECPQVYFFDRDGQRGFSEFVNMGHRTIVDWADSMVQGIDLLYHLGFRRIYLAGCEMRVNLSAKQREMAEEREINLDGSDLLTEQMKKCVRGGLSLEELDRAGELEVYHFDEKKPLKTAANTDFHYFRVVQYLRLARRSMSLAGLQLSSVTPGSRLNDHFPYLTVEEACAEILKATGDPALEKTAGRYRLTTARNLGEAGPMRDFRPHRREGDKKDPVVEDREKDRGENEYLLVEQEGFSRTKRLRETGKQIEKMATGEVNLCEEG